MSNITAIYEEAGIPITSPPQAEKESAEYAAFRFSLAGQKIIYREGKITPTKLGHFVTTWKRPKKEIVPFDTADEFDFLIVSIEDETHRGQFIFPRDLLIAQGIVASEKKRGKLSFRLYAPWIVPTSNAAKTSQAWQCKYFFTPNTIKTFFNKI